MPYWLNYGETIRIKGDLKGSRPVSVIRVDPFEPEEETPPARESKRTLRELLKLIFTRRSDQHDRR